MLGVVQNIEGHSMNISCKCVFFCFARVLRKQAIDIVYWINNVILLCFDNIGNIVVCLKLVFHCARTSSWKWMALFPLTMCIAVLFHKIYNTTLPYFYYSLFLFQCIFWQIFRFFRVIPAEQFLAEFSSDRRHMRRTDGTWIKQPPPYPPIQSNGKFKMQIVSKYFQP